MARAKSISPFTCQRADLDSSGSGRLQICLPESTDKNSGLVAARKKTQIDSSG